MRDRFRIWETLTVHWGDMDALGHVNNARYFTYFESARFRYFRAVGLEELGEGGKLGPVLVSTSCDFRRQIRYPATLEVGARTTRLGRTSFTMDYAVFEAGAEAPSAESRGVIVWVDYAANRPLPLPEALRDRVRALDRLDDEP
jgi:acyl-CoA thioester hydrolase